MVIIKTLLTGLVGISICLANIGGIVTDTGNVPISSAIVRLENSVFLGVSSTNGAFTITGFVGALPGTGQPLQNELSARICGSLLNVSMPKKAVIEITTFDLNGKSLSTVCKTIDAGTHSLLLPKLGSGIYLYKVKSGNNEFVLKGNSASGVSSGNSFATQDVSSNSLAKRAKTTFAINGVLIATKSGYLNTRVAVYNSDTGGIQIKMIRSQGSVTDMDENVYQAVKLGTQIWTVENLRVTKYNDGSPIPYDTSSATWLATTPKFCYYGNITNADSIKKRGALYNWHVVSPANPKKIAPAGWHVPSDAEWDTLKNYLIANKYNWDGTLTGNKIAKSLASNLYWSKSTVSGSIGKDLTTNDRSGFSATPGGGRSGTAEFGGAGTFGGWWTSSGTGSGYVRILNNYSDSIQRKLYIAGYGLSVRLVKD